jgi:ABC-2 type transport system permease protein
VNPTVHAVRVGPRRGWTEFLLSLRSPQDQASYLLIGTGVLAYLWLNRADEAAGTGLLLPRVALPGIIGGLVAFGIVTGAAGALAMEREDGTLLRMKAVPRGMVGYVTGQLLYQSLSMLPMLAVILVPGALLLDGVLPHDPAGWLAVAGFLLLGLLATLPFGIVLGSVIPSLQKVNTWALLPMLLLAGVSGIFVPLDSLWGWLQAVAQVFPMYWLGLGLRSAFLPDSAAAVELGGSWRSGQAVAVLAAWAVAGALLAPVVLRRMARRQSGASVAAARETAAQWVR